MVFAMLKGFGLIMLLGAVFGLVLPIFAEVLTKNRRIPTYKVTSVHPMRGGPPIKRAERPIRNAA
ncbi:MAG: hypothetical protein ACREIS_12550 [Nitrospiraceae bacterium]